MTDYALYLESGPRRRKTMVHVLGLLGCVANGPTTEDALAATPEAIAAFRGFLTRHGEEIDTGVPIETHIEEHITEGSWLGNGSPYITFGPDLVPLSAEELESYLQRFHWLREELAGWAATRSDAQLGAQFEGGRTAQHILLHVLDNGYLAAALGGASGLSRVKGAAERGEISLVDALRRIDVMAADRIRATTPEERALVRERPREVRTLRKALRRMLEHNWEHLAELSRRPGGPRL